MPNSTVEQIQLVTKQLPGHLNLIFQLTTLPSQSLITRKSSASVTTPLMKFAAYAQLPKVQDEFVSAIVERMKSPGAIQMFQDRISLEIMSIINAPSYGNPP
ncbi:hypothetical protein C8J56DRAFT_1046456 [Mycena floridula]|nr:hypothetical protein C8J56DRAFT_1046456 [Mycena floridula]